MPSMRIHDGPGGLVKPNALVVATIALVIFAADQISKYSVVQSLGMGGAWSPFSDKPWLLTLSPGFNTGTACGYLPQFGSIFTFAPFLILAIVIIFYRQQQHPGWLLSIGTGLIIGGAFGNLADRLRQGFVVDFIQVSRWPVFNVADAAVSTAVVMMLFWSLKEETGRTVTAEGVALPGRGVSMKLVLSFLVLLGILAVIGTVVCVYIPSQLNK